jgi:hypothetical protein
MATARLDLRLDEEIKSKAEKTSALLGVISFFVLEKKCFIQLKSFYQAQ